MREVCGRVLEVGVEDRCVLPGRLGERSPDGRAFAAVLRVEEEAGVYYID